MTTKQTISMMEPLMPQEGEALNSLSEVASDLLSKSGELHAKLHPIVLQGIGKLVRKMNCYYSNFIEGHNTRPYDIERALKQDFSKDIQKRYLQLEAVAHIELQEKIDESPTLNNISSPEFIAWLHKSFCEKLPEEMLWVENEETGEKRRVIPGQFRDGNVIVGGHIAIDYEVIPQFLKRFESRYGDDNLSKFQQIIAVAASHHRLLWIHPFYDGNGRVARLFSHAFLKKIGIGSSLWSISRGLARNNQAYKQYLMAADSPRKGNYDGRGALSEKELVNFCSFFLNCCLDQIEFMASLIQVEKLLNRIERWTQNQISAKELSAGSFELLREALLLGQFERGEASRITHYQERQARTVLNQLVKKELLISDTPKGAVRLNFPVSILEDWFPKLYLG